MIFFRIEVILSDRDVVENLLARKKIQIKAWYSILRTEILSNEDFRNKNTQTSEENELYPA